MPFYEQFARESVPQAYWSSPTFKKINRVLSAGWSLAIFAVGVSRVLAAAINGHHRRLPEILAWSSGAIVLYMLKFSRATPDNVTTTSQLPQRVTVAQTLKVSKTQPRLRTSFGRPHR